MQHVKPDTTSQESKRPYLDSLRGIAAVIVVCTHFLQAFYPYAVFGANYQQQTWVESLAHWPPFSLAVAGHFAVCLFFILSGFVLTNGHMQSHLQPKRRLIKAMLKRPIRLGGMVAFGTVASYALLTCGFFFNDQVSALTGSQPWFRSFWPDSITSRTFVGDLFLNLFSSSEVYNPPMWTIHKELKGSYIVFFYLLFRMHLKGYQRVICLIVLFLFMRNSLYVGFVIGLAFAELDRLPSMDHFRTSHFALLSSFALGLLLGMQPHYVQPAHAHTSFVLNAVNKFGTGGFAMVGAMLIFGSVLGSKQIQRILNHHWLCYVGSISYAMYALHFLLIGSITCWLYLNMIGSLGHFLATIIAVLLSLIVLLVLSDIVTKTVDRPANQFSNWLTNRLMPEGKLLESFDLRSIQHLSVAICRRRS